MRWWSAPFLATLATVMTYRFAQRLIGGQAAALVAAILASNAVFVRFGSLYYSHNASVVCVVLAATLLIRRDRDIGVPVWRLVGAGAALGMCVAIRPLTGAAMAFSLWLWLVLGSRGPQAALMRATSWLGLGSVVPVGAVLVYNRFTTGAPLRFGYDLVEGGYHRLGFGLRGFIEYNAVGQATVNVAQFGIREALAHMAIAVGEWASMALPCALLVPLLSAAWSRGWRVRWMPVACFAALPGAYFFYFYPSTRFYLELLPFALTATMGAWQHLRTADRRSANTMAGLVIVAAALHVVCAVIDDVKEVAVFRRFDDLVIDGQQKYGKMLIFVDTDKDRAGWESLFRFNAEGFAGEVIVARDLGAEDARLVAKYPSHRPFRLTTADGKGDAQLVPLVLARADQ
ncbi:MAG: hypothetical protein NVSMB53_19740 [Gemmatimonadaceae bacterium]